MSEKSNRVNKSGGSERFVRVSKSTEVYGRYTITEGLHLKT